MAGLIGPRAKCAHLRDLTERAVALVQRGLFQPPFGEYSWPERGQQHVGAGEQQWAIGSPVATGSSLRQLASVARQRIRAARPGRLTGAVERQSQYANAFEGSKRFEALGGPGGRC